MKWFSMFSQAADFSLDPKDEHFYYASLGNITQNTFLAGDFMANNYSSEKWQSEGKFVFCKA